jgi:hypothetical protein
MERCILRPMPPTNLIGGSVLVIQLVRVLANLDKELSVRASGDGCLYLAHRFTPDVLVAKIDLTVDPPQVEQLSHFPGLEDQWLDLDKIE